MDIPMKLLLMLSIPVTVVAIVTMIVVVAKTKCRRSTTIMVCILCALVTCAAIAPHLIWQQALAHGAYDTLLEDTKRSDGTMKQGMTLAQILRTNKISPVQDDLSDGIDKTILVFYRYGCPDCADVYDQLRPYVNGKGIRWVSTRSTEGKELVQEFGVAEVPSAVYVRDREKGENVYEVLYEQGESSDDETRPKAAFLEDRLRTLIDMQAKDDPHYKNEG